MRTGKFLTAAILIALMFAATLTAAGEARRYQTGRLIAVEISGQGTSPDSKTKLLPTRRDLWWTYCICAEDRTYMAVLRKSPAKTGLTVDSLVKFSADKNRIYVFNPQGQRHAMKILRQDREKTCP
jgi:hypothetical protein